MAELDLDTDVVLHARKSHFIISLHPGPGCNHAKRASDRVLTWMRAIALPACVTCTVVVHLTCPVSTASTAYFLFRRSVMVESVETSTSGGYSKRFVQADGTLPSCP